MVQKYLDELSEIIENAISVNILWTDLQYKHFFSGAAAYVNNKIFCTNTPKGIAIKIPKERRDKFLKSKGVSELRYFPKAPIKKDYIVLSSEIVENKEELHYWISLAINYVITSK